MNGYIKYGFYCCILMGHIVYPAQSSLRVEIGEKSDAAKQPKTKPHKIENAQQEDFEKNTAEEPEDLLSLPFIANKNDDPVDRASQLLTFIKSNVDVNQQDQDGNTALHIAVQKNDILSTKILQEAGADSSILNHQGLSPLDYAVQNHNQEIFKYLLDHFPADNIESLIKLHDRLADQVHKHVLAINKIMDEKTKYKYPKYFDRQGELNALDAQLKDHTKRMQELHAFQGLLVAVPGFHEKTYINSALEMGYCEAEAKKMFKEEHDSLTAANRQLLEKVRAL